ncbi:Calcium-transporting ATPase 1 [Planctomycetes bacterium Pan216]|uniref:Calcium-transporting ATPase 1 n=1 Tax=Kolteria novifilia TaxID=2527975 RepID=A0A518BBP4_9BACT|nr:Calcium-transporting ATPase 1 [Planctomycetes bacterium Pan216]
MSTWYQESVSGVTSQLDSPIERGLAEDEAKRRFAQHGPNELVETGGRGPAKILLEQLSGAMVVLLMVAAGVSALLGEFTDSVVILVIVVLNAALGFVQDYRAEKALAALKKLAVPIVRVRRGGSVREVSARELVPGDMVLLEAGNYVPADCRLWESVNLKVQESALTGESEPVEKQVEALAGDDMPLGDRTNMAYMGTVVTYGHGQAVVTETGMETELGQIARSLQTVEAEPTPLQKRLAQLGRALAMIAIAIVALVFAMGVLRGENFQLMLMTAMSLAVAIVPEGLPAVATVTLAIGARRMFHRRALIRKLPAVETLGSVTVICSDKTGTLTENRMTVSVLDVAGHRLELSKDSRTSSPSTDSEDSDQASTMGRSSGQNASLALLLTGASLCNDAELDIDEKDQELRAIGDPTEGALAVAAARFGLHKDELSERMPRVAEVPFDSDRKRMTTVHRIESSSLEQDDGPVPSAMRSIVRMTSDHIAFTKGAVDAIVDACQQVWDGDELTSMTDDWRRRISRANEELAASGMRVLGVAMRPFDTAIEQESGGSPTSPTEDDEQNLIFIGMLGIIDPPRAEAAESVARCRLAGIRPVMITGDHPLTATHIARQLSIAEDGQVRTGQELEGTSGDELRRTVETTSVYARVAPKHKLQLVQALQDNGHVVAMTGDGVNDAPALKQAHIGVAMGITGTDVSKEASQMVLLDDNFSTIVNAVEEGRIVYDNIRKFVKYTMTSNAGEVWVMVLGPLMGMPLPLLPLQILWVNLVTDGLPGLALALEQAERNTMKRPPYPPKEHILGRGMGWDIAWIGLLMGVVSLAMGYWWWASGAAGEARWRTIVFTVLTLAQMGNAMALRSDRDSLFRIGIFSNRALIGAVALTFGLQLGVIYWAPLQGIFKTTGLTLLELISCIALSTIVFWAVEGQKLLFRSRDKAAGESGA